MKTRFRWSATASLAVAAAATALMAAPVAAVTTTAADEAGAGWLAQQLVDGTHLEVSFGGTAYPDYGLTIDAVFAFAAAGVAGDAADAGVGYLAQHVDDYRGYAPEQYAGPTAKLALVAQVAGLDPSTFGGADLIAELQSLEGQDGRFSDASAYGDYSNTFGQALAILALEREGAGASANAVAFLAGAACDDGGFPEAFGAQTCSSSVDATAFAVQALAAAGDALTAGAGLDFLVAAQNDDGSFDGAVPASTNSSGLAAQALRAGGRADAADAAVAFLLTRQQGCATDAAVRGAFGSEAAFDATTAERATAQAVPGIAGVGFADLDLTVATAQAPTLDCPAPTTTTTATTAPAGPTSTTIPATPPAGDPLTTLSGTTAGPGQVLTVAEPGFTPGETVTIVLYSEPTVLAAVKADATGKVTASITIPVGTPKGTHTLVLLGASKVKVATIEVTAPAAIARTGRTATPLAVLGVTTLAGGVALVELARRRRLHLVG